MSSTSPSTTATSRPASPRSWRLLLANAPKAPDRGYRAFRALVSGSVQGVGFRYWAQREAESLGLVGWIRNLDDGDVELWAEGPSEALADFRAWLDEGPPGAVVDSVRAESLDPTGRYAAFTIGF